MYLDAENSQLAAKRKRIAYYGWQRRLRIYAILVNNVFPARITLGSVA
jgi:hypothetical protein